MLTIDWLANRSRWNWSGLSSITSRWSRGGFFSMYLCAASFGEPLVWPYQEYIHVGGLCIVALGSGSEQYYEPVRFGLHRLCYFHCVQIGRFGWRFLAGVFPNGSCCTPFPWNSPVSLGDKNIALCPDVTGQGSPRSMSGFFGAVAEPWVWQFRRGLPKSLMPIHCAKPKGCRSGPLRALGPRRSRRRGSVRQVGPGLRGSGVWAW